MIEFGLRIASRFLHKTKTCSRLTFNPLTHSVSSPLILILILLTLDTISCSLTLPLLPPVGRGVIDMDSYQQTQHPHRHSRTNNLLFKAMSAGIGIGSGGKRFSDSSNNVFRHNRDGSSSDVHLSDSNESSGGSFSKHLANSLSMQILYANGVTESTLPECESSAVCNKIETYDKPWVEKQCKCSNQRSCSTSMASTDPYSLYDKTRQYKLCEPIRQLKKCRYFRDVTWTITTKGDNVTGQIVHCQCPKDSVAYMIKRGVYRSDSDGTIGFKYSFACSPISRALCQRKEPCRLFSLKRRSSSSNYSINDVNSSILCQCPKGFTCPAHHLDAGVIRGKLYPENSLKTYSGYCIQ